MLASLKDVLPLLDKSQLCLPAFDIGGGQPDILLGILRTCEEARCPAVLLVWGRAPYMGLEACTDLVSSLARRASVPVVLHLDHGQPDLVEEALKLGLKSVMFDGSKLPLDENIRATREMVKMARSSGATIEGELGTFGEELGEGPGMARLTDPEEAGRFTRETGVDIFAPAVGNAHGWYKQPPRLRFELIRQIAEKTGVPLSLHGGTGIPLEDVRKSGLLGMRKINVATQIHRDFSDALQAAVNPEPGKQYTWRRGLSAGRDAVAARIREYITGLGVAGIV